MDAPISEIPLLILAGGKATRLKELSQNLPKYVMPVSGTRTFADIHLEWAKKQGFRKIFVSVGHFADKIETHCGDGSKYGLEIKYFKDGPQLLGTGGAVFKSLSQSFEILAVTYGDTLLTFEVNEFLEKFAKSKKLAGMTVYRNDLPGHQSNICLNGDQVTYDKQKPQASWEFIDYGFLALKRAFIEKFPYQVPLDLATLLSEASYQENVFGYPVQTRFWEIGSPEALIEFQRQFK